MSQSWYINLNGKVNGPFTQEQIDKAIKGGKVPPHAEKSFAADGPWFPVFPPPPQMPEDLPREQPPEHRPHRETPREQITVTPDKMPVVITSLAAAVALGFLLGSFTGPRFLMWPLLSMGFAISLGSLSTSVYAKSLGGAFMSLLVLFASIGLFCLFCMDAYEQKKAMQTQPQYTGLLPELQKLRESLDGLAN